MEPIKTLIVDGVEHAIETFSPAVQNLVHLRQQWIDELATERSKVFKTEAAIRQLEVELGNIVQQELNEPEDEDVPTDDMPVAE